MCFADGCFSNCAEQSHKNSERKATVEEQLCTKTIHPATRVQLQLPTLDLSWTLSAARQSTHQRVPSSNSLLLISPGLCQQQDNQDILYGSPAPPPGSSSLLGSQESDSKPKSSCTVTAKTRLTPAGTDLSLGELTQNGTQRWTV